MFECKSEVVSRTATGCQQDCHRLSAGLPQVVSRTGTVPVSLLASVTLAADEFDKLGVEHLGVAFVCGTQMLDDVLYLVVVACEIPAHAVSSNDPARRGKVDGLSGCSCVQSPLRQSLRVA